MKKVILYGLVVTLLMGVTIPTAGFAATFRGGEEERVAFESPVDDDIYAAGNSVFVTNSVEGDVMAAGQRVEITGDVAEDIYLAGQSISVAGSVGDDAHVGGNEISVSGTIAGDMFAGGQNIIIGEDAVIDGDAYLGGSSIIIRGTIRGTVRAAGSAVTLDPSAVIEGDFLTYGERPVISEGATIQGRTEHVQTDTQATPQRRNHVLDFVMSTLRLFIVALLLAWVVPVFVRAALQRATGEPGWSLLTGAIWLVLFIPASVLLLISSVGISTGFWIIGFTLTGYVVAAAIAALWIGGWLLENLLHRSRGTEKPAFTEVRIGWPHALVGAALYTALQLVPIVGWLVTFLFVVAAWGAILRALWKAWGRTPVAS